MNIGKILYWYVMVVISKDKYDREVNVAILRRHLNDIF